MSWKQKKGAEIDVNSVATRLCLNCRGSLFVGFHPLNLLVHQCLTVYCRSFQTTIETLMLAYSETSGFLASANIEHVFSLLKRKMSLFDGATYSRAIGIDLQEDVVL